MTEVYELKKIVKIFFIYKYKLKYNTQLSFKKKFILVKKTIQ